MKEVMGICCVVLLVVGTAGGIIWLSIASGNLAEVLGGIGIAATIIGLIFGAVWGLK